jgi:hypothetical protein
LLDLVAPCPTTGHCQADDTLGPVSRACFDSGVREEQTVSGDCNQATWNKQIQVLKPDGSLCYERTVTAGQLCESSWETWTDESGAVIAMGSSPFNGTPTLTCTSGESSSCYSKQGHCEWAELPALACDTGHCP